MSQNHQHSQSDAQAGWEQARSRKSSEMLAVLEPTPDEPQAVGGTGIWKTGTRAVPAPGSAA